MMEIKKILMDKRETLLKTGNPLQVDFTLPEVNVLGDVNELRKLKLSLAFPEDFDRSPDLFACTKKIIDGDSDYRVLEFCVLKNKILRVPVSQVFSKILG